MELNKRNECIIAYKRKGNKAKDDILVILNMTPVVRNNVEIIVSGKKQWKEVFNSDNKAFWGTGDVYNTEVKTILIDKEKKLYSFQLNLSPLAMIILKGK